MLQQKLNINSVQKNLPKLMDLVVRGDEIIITKSEVPIAKISPLEEPKLSYTSNFIRAKSLASQRNPFRDAPEYWFG